MILLIGYLGYVTNQLDGQTVQTRSVLELLQKKSGQKVIYFDTQELQKNKFLVFKLLLSCFRCNNIFYLPGRNNIRFFFPILIFSSALTKANVHYVVIGGWLADFIKNRKILQWCTSKCKAVYVYSQPIKQELVDLYQFNNLVVLPNFREVNFIASIKPFDGNLKLVFMSRIILEKGIDVLFRFAQRWQFSEKRPPINLHFYGQIDKNIEDWFFDQVGKYVWVEYKGALEPAEIYDSLNQYDLLLLPTRYDGEGSPGAVIDAYFSGIPVLLSDWKYNSGLVEQGKTGFLFDLENEIEIDNRVIELITSPEKLLDMKKASLEKSKEFTAEKGWKIISQQLN